MPSSTRSPISLSRHRRQTSSTISSNESRSPTSSFGSSTYRSTTLETSNISVEHEQMDDERWCRLAFALGMPYGEVRHHSPESAKLVQRVRAQKHISSKGITRLIAPLLLQVSRKHGIINFGTNSAFHQDSVPHGLPGFEMEGSWRTKLPTPKPTFTFGYSSDAFTSHELELQRGIIANSRNEPCDLDKLSQPVPDVFWPFLVLESHEGSMAAARNACADSAAACNNAPMVFAAAVQQPAKRYHDLDFLWGLSKAAQSFSLAINGKTACLNTHNSEGCLPHGMATIRTYRLDDERDVEAMAARIRSILIWAENCRLQSILDLLQGFDKRVELAKDSVMVTQEVYVPPQLEMRSQPSRKRRGVIRNVIVDSLPRWAREF
ncbi:hypothetical protein HRR86_007600 [Exophiala dermatitidis]|uniref:DUF7924 domain-containing protein n=2 Tax=Exophiala dermatitidis TaxID=5970 RepID=H6BRS4_EXODN|nr:uncharacterized protein HMPREF1120_02203 [Exophiala dermatitidis NIH/UT8656]KAJ4515627.1 hypothetical protein HRR75_003706 [Exophiala dermatitidis]EHY54026.1 hypothetical protein HMPREF1120_02203 [Exophiala dermatitidis NIH/UT8656]KAJ4538523.1 hypothetical protein HRR77_007006 [Exophiala dermatitidis]KAJ4557849.1 hypothetical protein HRR78_001524 [Exophiala dermatitidis]KAJ4613751.1 hypothetical protein HRR85_004043 [Exophiala dermatitidis]